MFDRFNHSLLLFLGAAKLISMRTAGVEIFDRSNLQDIEFPWFKCLELATHCKVSFLPIATLELYLEHQFSTSNHLL